jgi:hypothetical protein
LAESQKPPTGEGEKDIMHRYTLEFLEEWWQQE